MDSSSSNHKVLTVTDTSEEFDYFLNQPYVTDELRESIKDAQILFVPSLGFRDIEKPVFPVGTETLFHFFKDKAQDINIDIIIEDSDYAELALHADTKKLGVFVVSAVVLPLFLNVLSSYIYEKIRPAPKDKIEFSVTIVKHHESKRVNFEGSADDFKKLSPEIERLFEGKK
jgi:hypothetical protein